MYNLAQAGYTESEVITALKDNRTVSYGYELLDKYDQTIGEIEASNSKINNNSEINIKFMLPKCKIRKTNCFPYF